MAVTPHRLTQSLLELARGLDSAGLPFAVAGAHAVAIHGHVRATRDIDFLIRVEDFEAADRVMLSMQYVCVHRSMAFAHYERRPMPELPGLVERADLLLSSLELGCRILDAARQNRVSWQGVSVPVVPVGELILMKLIAANSDPRRLQDLIDIRELLAAHRAQLDLDWLREHASALGPGIRRSFDQLLSTEQGKIGEGLERYAGGGLGI